MKSIITKRPRTVALFVFAILLLAFVLSPKAPRSTSSQNHAANPAPVGVIPLAVDPFSDNNGFITVLYNSTNGLPTSEANAIAQTSEGFIWIGG